MRTLNLEGNAVRALSHVLLFVQFVISHHRLHANFRDRFTISPKFSYVENSKLLLKCFSPFKENIKSGLNVSLI